MRPDRAVVVGHRVVARLGRGDRPDSPAGEEGGPQELLRDRRGAVFRHNAGKQQLAGVGGPHPARPLSPVERQRVGADVLAPERLFEANPQVLRLALQARSARSARPAAAAILAASRLAA